MSILGCESLCQQYTQGGENLCIFQQVNFSLAVAEQVAIMGNSGSGKSSFLAILGGLSPPSAGHVYWEEKKICNYSESLLAIERNRFMGFVYQSHHLVSELNVIENVALPLYMRPRAVRQEALEEAGQVLSRIGLAGKELVFPSYLSGGERQRVSLARALVTKPACILADEPTGHLDEKMAHQMLNFILEMTHMSECALVLVTHNISIANRLGGEYCLSCQKLERIR